MSDSKTELEWKNHSPFFVNLNDDLKKLKIIGSNKDMAWLRNYYDELNDMKKHYSVYLSNAELKDLLKKCNQVVYAQEFDSAKWTQGFHKKVINTRDDLNEIHEKIIGGLFDNGLIPRFDVVDTSGPAATRVKR